MAAAVRSSVPTAALVLFTFFSHGASNAAIIDPAATRNNASAVLQQHCLKCHAAPTIRGGLDLSTRERLLAGGDSGQPAAIPGNATQSLLIQKVKREHRPEMPYKESPLTESDIAQLAEWIDAGAHYAAPLKPPAAQAVFWSLRPLVKPPLPSVADDSWARNPIDVFIRATLDAAGLSPAPPADAATWLRRVSFTLTGLPPTPADLHAFAQDPSPVARSKAIDRLLASPRYGERWARHWMDIVHFAETHGHDQDRIRTNAWPYRDYLISAFNEDKPYARFITEQLAGDILYPSDPQAVVATGFIAAGPWDESSLMAIMDDTVDKKIARYLDRDDMVTTTMSTFTSSTVHCARCHDHKFDPISQEDYYSVQAVFAGIDRADRPYDTDRRRHIERRRLKQRLQELQRETPATVAALLRPDTQRQVAHWEKQVSAKAVSWKIVQAESATAGNGSILTPQPDGSLLASGPCPDTDVYTVTFRCPLTKAPLTGLRLELLTDPSLPHQGPGRQRNGNLHLSELRLNVSAPGDPTALGSLRLQNPRADFDQTGWTIAHALDGKPETAWGIHPQVGKPHSAVIEIGPTNLPPDPTFTVQLRQLHGQQHLIGRFRLAVTDAPLPLPNELLPETVNRILATPSAQRSPADVAALTKYYLMNEIHTQLAALGPPALVYAASREFAPEGNFKPADSPRPVHLLKRGDVTRPEQPVAAGALSCLPGLPSRFALAEGSDEGARRAALAHWIADPRNVLTWRSIVNRVWHYHFGRGLVDTPSDFGQMGGKPTHPELLDWMATTFLETGGSIKQLHRLILTSAAYGQSTQHHPVYSARDGDNRLLWRMNAHRLDAESIRDTMLQLGDNLDLTMGGPSAQQFLLSPGIHVTPKVDYAGFDVDTPAGRRRSVYRFLFRTLPDPMMDSLDCPDASQLAPTRSSSVTVLQALTMLHNEFVVRQSEKFATRLQHTAADTRAQIAAACESAWGRAPSSAEAELMVTYADRHGLPNLCRYLFNSNEFVFLQ